MTMRILLALFLPATLHAAPKLIAHRGASSAAPENTLAAFKQAWVEGADGIEGDFRLSKDGRIVCIHDEDTKRTTGKKLVVAKSDWSQLKVLDAGSWKNKRFASERLPLLGEILAILPPEKYFFVEIKCGPEIVSPLKEALKSADPRHIVIISFNPEVIRSCREGLPRFQAHLVSKLDGIHKKGAREKQFDQLKALNATGLQFRHDARVDAAFIDTLHQDALLTACWTIDDPKVARRIAGLGVDFITTNRPAAIRRDTDWPE